MDQSDITQEGRTVFQPIRAQCLDNLDQWEVSTLPVDTAETAQPAADRAVLDGDGVEEGETADTLGAVSPAQSYIISDCNKMSGS